MSELIMLIACIAISIYSYKKVALRLRSKERGKLNVLLISLSCSTFIFMISVAVGASIIGESPQDKDTRQVNTIIKKEFNGSSIASKNENTDLEQYINTKRADLARTYKVNTNELESIFGPNTKILVNNSGKEQIKQFIFDGADKSVYVTYSGKEALLHWDAVEKFIEAEGKEDFDLTKFYGATSTYYYKYYYSPSKQQKYLMICNKGDCTTLDKLNVWRLRGEFAKDGSEYLKKHNLE